MAYADIIAGIAYICGLLCAYRGGMSGGARVPSQQ
jgi:hypothetical protein